MTMNGDLKRRRIAVLVADGFEKVELTIPVTALRMAGAAVDVISLRHGRIRGVNLHEPAGRVRVDRTVYEADPADYDGLFIPGGFINPDLLRQSAEARAFVREFDREGKPIASLCHGLRLTACRDSLKAMSSARGCRLRWPMVRLCDKADDECTEPKGRTERRPWQPFHRRDDGLRGCISLRRGGHMLWRLPANRCGFGE